MLEPIKDGGYDLKPQCFNSPTLSDFMIEIALNPPSPKKKPLQMAYFFPVHQRSILALRREKAVFSESSHKKSEINRRHAKLNFF